VSYTYTNTGLQATVTDASGTTDYSYDDYGNQIEAITPEGTIYYYFDDATGQSTGFGDSSTDIEYGYNTLGQLVTVTAQYLGGTYVDAITTYAYDPAGNMISEIMPNGVTNTFTYNSLNELTGITDAKGGTTLYSETDTYYDDGMKASSIQKQLQTDNSTVVTTTDTFSYDALDRLTGETLTSSAANSSYTNSFTYDLNSNQMSETHVGPGGGSSETLTYTYDNNNEMKTEISSLSGTTYFTYDLNGSLTTQEGSGGTNTYSYDVRNRMVGANVGGVSTTYVYDDAGDRVSETTAGTTTLWLTNTNNPTGYNQPMEEKIGGSLAESYVIGDKVLGQSNAGGTLSWLLTDGQDDTRLLTNSSGTVTAVFSFDALGNPLNFDEATAPTDILFQQTLFDSKSGLDLFGDGTRGAEPGEDQFVEEDDPIYGDSSDPITLNLRLLEDADLENLIDPTGHVGELLGEELDSDALELSLQVQSWENEGGVIALAENDAVEEEVTTELEFDEGETVVEEAEGKGSAAKDQLESIEKAQQNIRSGSDKGKRIIDSIEKSNQALKNLLRGPYDPSDWE
jgi:large repetitive protein